MLGLAVNKVFEDKVAAAVVVVSDIGLDLLVHVSCGGVEMDTMLERIVDEQRV